MQRMAVVLLKTIPEVGTVPIAVVEDGADVKRWLNPSKGRHIMTVPFGFTLDELMDIEIGVES